MTVRMAASLADPSAGAALDKAVADDDHAAGKKANAPDEENAEAAAEHQAQSQRKNRVAQSHSELEHHHATMIEGKEASKETTPQLRHMTRDQEELSAELAESSAEGKALSQLESASESRCTQLERQLDSLTQQLSTSQAKSADLLDQLRTVNQGIISSRTRCAELKAELAEEHAARSRLESELDLLSQQPARNGAGAELPSASSARKAETAQEELQKLRESLGTSEELIIELKQKVTDLEAARAAGEAAVQTHLAMREQQTQRIRKAKAGGLKGLQTVTAEREDALMRADRAELQSQRLRQQLVELQKKLGDFSSVRNRYVAESASSHLHAELAPASPPSQPLTSAQNLDSALSAQLDEQLTAAAVSASAGDADLKSAYAELASERGRFESAKAVLSTELAVLTQRLQELSSHV